MQTKFISAFALLVASSSLASAQVLIWHPPAKYDRPYGGKVVEHRYTWQEARSVCSRMERIAFPSAGIRTRPDACQWMVGRVCHIAIPAGPDVTPEETVAYRKHETAHCNGWGEDHDGGY